MILGCDISVWQTNDAQNPTYFFDPFLAKEKGMEFAFIRASSGSLIDKAVNKVAPRFEQAKLPFGFYHYIFPDISYITQADKFLSVVNQYDYQLPLVVDVEQTGVGLDIVRLFCGRVASKTGKKMIIYTRGNVWNEFIGVKNATWALEHDYWVAHYMKVSFPVYGIPSAVQLTTTYPTQLEPWKSHGKPWTFWQFCASGDGEFYGGDYAKHTDKVGLDMNVFNGTLEEFNAKFGITDIPDVEPEPEPEVQQYRTKVYLRGRTKPIYLAGESALIFPPDTILDAADEPTVYEYESGITWRQVKIWVSNNSAYIEEL